MATLARVVAASLARMAAGGEEARVEVKEVDQVDRSGEGQYDR